MGASIPGSSYTHWLVRVHAKTALNANLATRQCHISSLVAYRIRRKPWSHTRREEPMRSVHEPAKKRKCVIRPIASNKRTQSSPSEVYTDTELDEIDARNEFLVPTADRTQYIQQQAARKINALVETTLPCCVCELDCERDDISVYSPTPSLLAIMRARLVVKDEMSVPPFIQAQYDASHIDNRLKGILLLPAGKDTRLVDGMEWKVPDASPIDVAIPHFDDIFQFQICNTCMSEMRNDKSVHPPTLAIANGNYIGRIPDEFNLGRTDEQAIALVSPCMSLSTVTGGPCRSIKSHHYVVRNTEGPLVSMLPTDLSSRVRVTMVRNMTSVQAAACKKRYEINLPRCRKTLAFLYENNSDYQAYMDENRSNGNTDAPFQPPESNVVVDQSEISTTMRSVDEAIVDEIRDDSSYSRRDVEEGEASLEMLWEDRSSVILPQEPGKSSGFTDVLVRKSNSFVSLQSWTACTKMFPVLFPGGCGGPTEPRKRHLSVKKWIQRCLRVHGHRFERHYAFLLLAFDYLASKHAHETLFIKMHVSSAALKASQIPRSILHEAMKYYEYVVDAKARGCKPRPPPPDVQRVVDLRRGLRSSESAFFGSNLSRMRARHDVFGMLKRFGHCSTVQTSAVREANALLLPNKSERRAIAAQYPVECGRYFVRVVDTIIDEFLGWDQNRGRPKRGGGIFGVVRAFTAAAETQVAGDLHAHFVVWLHGFPQTSAAMDQALETNDHFRSRLINLTDQILTTKPPCIADDEELTCPRCHTANALFPIVPSVGAYRHPCAGAKPEATSQCSACRSTFRDRDVINAAIDALAVREDVHVITHTSDYTRCRPPIVPETALSVSLIVRDVQVHYWNHTRSCFKVTVQTPKRTVCRFFKPEPPHLGRTCIEDGQIRLHRPIGCEYVNGYNETLLSVLRCNHDVKFVLCTDSKNTAAYLCKYCMKAQNPVENNAALSIAAFAKAVNRTDLLPPEFTPSQVGRSILCSMLYTVTNGQEVAAPIAALYLIRGSPFWFSHEAVHVDLGAALDVTSKTEEVYVSPSQTKNACPVAKRGSILDKYQRRPVGLNEISFIDFCEQDECRSTHPRRCSASRSSSAPPHRSRVLVVCGRQLPDISDHIDSNDRDFYYVAILTLFKPHCTIASILDGQSPQSAYSQFLQKGNKNMVKHMKIFEDRLQDAYRAEKTNANEPTQSREEDLMRTHPPPSTPWQGVSDAGVPFTSATMGDLDPPLAAFQDEPQSPQSITDLAKRASTIVENVRSIRTKWAIEQLNPLKSPLAFPSIRTRLG